jgi:hypothetical protein
MRTVRGPKGPERAHGYKNDHADTKMTTRIQK